MSAKIHKRKTFHFPSMKNECWLLRNYLIFHHHFAHLTEHFNDSMTFFFVTKKNFPEQISCSNNWFQSFLLRWQHKIWKIDEMNFHHVIINNFISFTIPLSSVKLSLIAIHFSSASTWLIVVIYFSVLFASQVEKLLKFTYGICECFFLLHLASSQLLVCVRLSIQHRQSMRKSKLTILYWINCVLLLLLTLTEAQAQRWKQQISPNNSS